MSTDLTGLWKTGSGAEYLLRPENDYIIALYWNPSAAQLAAGYVRGDLAYRGTLVGRILVGTFFQRFSVADKPRCPGIWERPTVLYLTVLDDGSELSGNLLEEHLADGKCVIDDRRLSNLVFRRVGDGEQETRSIADTESVLMTSCG